MDGLNSVVVMMMMIMMDLQTRGESVSAFSIFSGDASSFPYSSAGRSPPLHPSARAGKCSAALAYPVLMTFSKLSRGGRVCGAGSRGQAEMLQQIYSRGGVGIGAHGRGRAGTHILPKMLPRWPNLNLTRFFLLGVAGASVSVGAPRCKGGGGGVGPVGAPRCREGGRACWGSSLQRGGSGLLGLLGLIPPKRDRPAEG